MPLTVVNRVPEDDCERDMVFRRALVFVLQTIQIEIVNLLIFSPDSSFSFLKEGLS